MNQIDELTRRKKTKIFQNEEEMIEKHDETKNNLKTPANFFLCVCAKSAIILWQKHVSCMKFAIRKVFKFRPSDLRPSFLFDAIKFAAI